MFEEILSRIERKQDKILGLLHPIVEMDKELRANIMKEVSSGKSPRKQPRDTSVWKEAYKKRKSDVQ